MERGGISVRLIRFVHALVGHFRGGLLQVAVVSMYVISGLSGSKPADVAAVGTIMRDECARHGAPEGAAVLAVSAVMGETVPPSIAMLIVGSITNVSVAAMFIGGLMPAAVIALCLMALIAVRARRAGARPALRAPVRVVTHAGLNAILPLLMPGMLLAGILLGLATPTEIAALAVVYGLVLSMLVYRKLAIAGFFRALESTATLTGVLMFIFAAASAFSWVLTIAYLPQRLVDLLAAGHASATFFMLGSIALLIFVGVLLEGLPSLNVLAPLLLPIAVKLGFGPALRHRPHHRDGRRRLHAARRRRFLCLLRGHAMRHRARFARHAALSRRGAGWLADRGFRALVCVGVAQSFRISRLSRPTQGAHRLAREDVMNRRELLRTAAAAATLAAPHIARATAPLTMRFAHFAQEDHPANIAAKQFASRVGERTNGAIRVMIFPNNQLGGRRSRPQIKLGAIDMGLPTQGQLDKYDKAFGAVMLPFIFDNRALVFRVLDGPAMAWLAPLAEKQGFVLLRNWDYGFRNVTNSVRPIHAPEDVKGLKLRTPPELQIQASMEALGAPYRRSRSQSSIWRWRRRSSTARRTQSPSSTTTSSMRCRSTSRSPGTSTTT